jgi:hypothetical protein
MLAYRMRNLALGAAIASVLASATMGADSEMRLSGTLSIDQKRVSFLVSGNGGGGTLHYGGKSYPFTVGGIGVGGIGVTRFQATGNVYNLNSLGQFPGVYGAARTGHAVGDNGRGKLWLKNGDGVVLELKGLTEGVGLTMGADAVHIAFK